jgi:hypothetical protein
MLLRISIEFSGILKLDSLNSMDSMDPHLLKLDSLDPQLTKTEYFKIPKCTQSHVAFWACVAEYVVQYHVTCVLPSTNAGVRNLELHGLH